MTTPPDIYTTAIFSRIRDLEDRAHVVDAIHAIVADVIDSCALAVTSHLGRDGRGQGDLDIVAEEMVATVNDYVANHYGIEEFGL